MASGGAPFRGWGSDRPSTGTSQWPVAATHHGPSCRRRTLANTGEHWRTLANTGIGHWRDVDDGSTMSCSCLLPMTRPSLRPPGRLTTAESPWTSSQDTGVYSGPCTPAPLSRNPRTVLSVRLCGVPHGSDRSLLATLDSFPCTSSPPLLTSLSIPPVLSLPDPHQYKYIENDLSS
jgi:hypothetical protein